MRAASQSPVVAFLPTPPSSSPSGGHGDGDDDEGTAVVVRYGRGRTGGGEEVRQEQREAVGSGWEGGVSVRVGGDKDGGTLAGGGKGRIGVPTSLSPPPPHLVWRASAPRLDVMITCTSSHERGRKSPKARNWPELKKGSPDCVFVLACSI